jgi:SAM-dependent methyltransferase
VKRCFACGARFEAAGWTCPTCGNAPPTRGGFVAFAPELVDGSGEDADYTYDEMAAAEARHFWFVSRSRLIVWALHRYFPQARTLLEVGCGTGGVASAIRAAFPRLEMTATEVLVRGLAFATRKLPGVSLLQMDAHRIPFDAEFDVIAAFDVIEHIDDDRGVLRAMYEGIAPGGGVVLTVPQHQALWSPIDDFGCHRRRYSRRELQDKLRDAGFTVVRMTSFLSLLLPLLFAARWRLRSFDPEVDSELRVSPVLNGLLTGICSVERIGIRMGVSWPAGGSLLAVAVRPR